MDRTEWRGGGGVGHKNRYLADLIILSTNILASTR